MKKVTISGWGNFPQASADVEHLNSGLDFENSFIAQGNLKSYGDSAISNKVVNTKNHDCFLEFDEENGILRCQSGVMLSDIIEHLLPKGWFPRICPGTKYVTVGGAIASDVHGKNHHHAGAFSDSVIELNLLTRDGQLLNCSREHNEDWFRHTCGGMGLTGIIMDAKIKLQPIKSGNINQTKIKTANLQETFNIFDQYRDSSYSVAWIDCLARKNSLGRSIITIGEHAEEGSLTYEDQKKLGFPFFLPAFAFNPLTLKIMNNFLYHKVRSNESKQVISYEKYFFPLDGIENWNRAYGKNGFLQYQIVLPLENSFDGLRLILEKISNSGQGSFLAVLKRLGKENMNSLSFPKEGYTLALDFKNTEKVKRLFNELDSIVINHGGRFYLAKDARVPRDIFEKGYPEIENFRNFRKMHKLDQHYSSLQSRRLSL